MNVQEWYDAWNAHDLNRILSHYSEDVRFHSPFAERLVPGSGGLVLGKQALRTYFEHALAAYPELEFMPFSQFDGVDSVCLVYSSVTGKIAAETMVFDASGLVVEVRAQYASYRDVLDLKS